MNEKLNLPAVQVSRRGEERIESGHLWIYEADIVARGGAKGGDTVRVVTQRGRNSGIAHYSDSSKIPLRLLSRHAELPDRAFYLRRLKQAVDHRKRVVENSDAYRLVHAEGDLLPGLIVDVYGNSVAAQFLTQGMDRAKDEIVSCLEELLHPASIVARNDVPSRKHEKLSETPEMLLGEEPGRVPVHMNGITMLADVLHGQKTGVYLDQRENYVASARWAHGRALDCYTSTGGFALHIAKKCDLVEAVESAPAALEAARANAAENTIQNISFREADVFDYLSGCVQARRKFQTVILDPPAFAKSKTAIDAALAGLPRDQPEGAEAARHRRRPGDVLLQLPRQRGGAARSPRRSRARSGQDTAHPRAPLAGAGPSDPAHRAGDAVPEVPDRRGAVAVGQRQWDRRSLASSVRSSATRRT